MSGWDCRFRENDLERPYREGNFWRKGSGLGGNFSDSTIASSGTAWTAHLDTLFVLPKGLSLDQDRRDISRVMQKPVKGDWTPTRKDHRLRQAFGRRREGGEGDPWSDGEDFLEARFSALGPHFSACWEC